MKKKKLARKIRDDIHEQQQRDFSDLPTQVANGGKKVEGNHHSPTGPNSTAKVSKHGNIRGREGNCAQRYVHDFGGSLSGSHAEAF